MRRLALALLVCLGLAAAGTMGADIIPTQTTSVTLSCNDGHSAVLNADATTLTGLTTDVNAINGSGTNFSCGLDPSSNTASAETADWTVYDYNPSGRAISPRNSPNSMPATTTGSSTSFNFIAGKFTALLTTTDPALTGDLTGKTLTDNISLGGDATSFMTQNGGGDCTHNVPAAVRFYFTAPSASGPSTGTPPAGFYTKFWWSDAVKVEMLSGNQGQPPITESMTPADWSDWNGQPAASQAEAFSEAVQHVQSIGLSFGGDCFFETGVTPSSSFTFEQFSSNFSET